jgi:hypothetical protein
MRIPKETSRIMTDADADDRVKLQMSWDNLNGISDQSDDDHNDDESSDDDDGEGKPEIPDRGYTVNWSDFPDIRQHRDDPDRNILASSVANDLSNSNFSDNFILRERPPQDASPKLADDDRSITTDIDNEDYPIKEVRERPVPPKRTNIPRTNRESSASRELETPAGIDAVPGWDADTEGRAEVKLS